VSARIDENGAKTKKLWLKQGFRGLFVKKQSFQGLDLKKTGTNEIKPKLQGLACKRKGPGRRVLICKSIGFKTE
jgi:hypothetical protein